MYMHMYVSMYLCVCVCVCVCVSIYRSAPWRLPITSSAWKIPS
jgi:hypothetical protein